MTLEKKESAKLTKQKEATVKKTALVETERQGYEAERDVLNGRITQLDKVCCQKPKVGTEVKLRPTKAP